MVQIVRGIDVPVQEVLRLIRQGAVVQVRAADRNVSQVHPSVHNRAELGGEVETRREERG